MRTLQSELQSPMRETKIEFDALNNRIRCYAHIINICSSHVIASVTSTTKRHLSNLEVPLDSSFATRDDSDDRPDDDNSNNDSDDDSDDDLDDGSDDDAPDNGSDDDDFDDGSENDDPDDELDDGDVNFDRVVAKLALAKGYDINGNPQLRRWLRGIQRDPLGRARKVVRLLRSSDQRREGLRDFIETGNQHGLFFLTDRDGNRKIIKVPRLELLRDVKTRWDSVFLMLQRLRQLRPVSPSQ
jgi:hypothetical protein